MAERVNSLETIKGLVASYLERIKKILPEHCYALDQVGIWRIYSGTDFSNFSGISGGKPIGLYQGRFIDVIAEAVQLKEFYGKYIGKDPDGFSLSGCIILENIKSIPVDKDLDDLIKPF